IDSISGFSSASLQNNSPSQPNLLSFANTPAPLDGSFGGATHCIPDFYGTPSSFQTGPYYVNSGADATHLGTPLSVGAATPPVIYVDGDAVITNNILFSNASSYGSLSNIPSFYLIAKGNIYIDQHVNQIDGVFIAEPKSGGGGGRIYTCSSW